MTRRRTANPAAFDATEMNAVMGVGAPSYTSGDQKWKGTAATLNPKPTSTSMDAATTARGGMLPSAPPNSYRLVLPVNPYNRLKPYSITVEVNAPKRKYLRPDSALLS